MKHSLFTRLLSLFLVMALLIPCFPQALAEEVTEPAVVETTAPAETEEATEATEATETTEATEEPTVAPPQTDDPEPETAVPGETEPAEIPAPQEEAAPAALPYGLAGLPEGYVLDGSHEIRRQKMLDNGLSTAMAGLTAGKDYASDEILIFADSEEEALIYAEAYNGQLKNWAYGLATITLTDLDTPEAVALSLDDSLNLPVAAPNLIYRVEPIFSDKSQNSIYNMETPQEQTWNSFVHSLRDPDEYISDPNDYMYQYAHDVVGSYAAWGINSGVEYVNVGIIDTGVDTGHPDLHNVTAIDVGCGVDDDSGHGTHVAGIIGATLNNGIGGAGIAPDVLMTSYRVEDDEGDMYTEYIVRAVNEAAGKMDVINMSLGGPIYDAVFDEAVQRAVQEGTTVVAAMGNDGTNARQFPAAFDNVIAVGATGKDNRRAYFSNFGSWCDVSAPGVGITSTYPTKYTDYVMMDGTSMACPVVTGVCALYISAAGEHLPPAQVEKALKDGCNKIADKDMGAGIVSISNMLGVKYSAPEYEILDPYYNALYSTWENNPYKNQLLPHDSQLFLMTDKDDHSAMIVYTLDGKNPTVKKGEVTYGEVFYGPIQLINYAGSTVTVKALSISGMGIVSPVLTLKLKVAADAAVGDVEVSGSQRVIAGKSVEYRATVHPAGTAPQDVVWSLKEPLTGVSINPKTGKLTTKKGIEDTVTVVATSTVDPSKFGELEVSIEDLPPVSKMTLDESKMTVAKGYGGYLYVDVFEAKDDPYLFTDDYDFLWTSNKPHIATVDQEGNVYGVSRGTAVITCKVLDGSNKTAKCTVKVVQEVEEIIITGDNSVAPGTSTTLKATVLPKDADNKKVAWRLDTEVEGVTINEKTGKLTVSKDCTAETVWVWADATDDSYSSDLTYVNIQPKITSLSMSVSSEDFGYAKGCEYDKKGVLKTIHMFSTNLPDTEGNEKYVELFLDHDDLGDSRYCDFDWTSSKPDVAEVNEYGEVTALKAGKTKITATAKDGSKKKVSVNISVTNPASYIKLTSSAPQMSFSFPVIAAGKSVTHKVSFGETYGKPSNTKVEWFYEVYKARVTDDGYITYDESDLVTDLFDSKKLITLKNGKLSVNKKVENMISQLNGNEEYVVQVYAVSTDGVYATDMMEYMLIRPTKTVKCLMKPGAEIAVMNDGYFGLPFYSDQEFLFDKAVCAFTGTSSNPEIISLTFIEWNNEAGCYMAYFATGMKPGTATIKVASADGTNKSFSYKIKLVASDGVG